MVTKEISSDIQSTMGELGLASLPQSIQVGGNFEHIPLLDLEKIDTMFKQDGQVSGLWRLITTPLRSTRIRVHPKNSRAKREANFIEEVFNNSSHDNGMRTNFQSVMSTILRMLLDGWSAHEIVWRLDTDGFIRVDKLAYRPAKSIRVRLDKHGDILSYTQSPELSNVQLTQQLNSINIPLDKVLHFVHGSHEQSSKS